MRRLLLIALAFLLIAAVAHAGTLTLMGVGPGAKAIGTSPAAVVTVTTGNPAIQNPGFGAGPYSFSVNLGTSASGRLVIVGVHLGFSTGATASVTMASGAVSFAKTISSDASADYATLWCWADDGAHGGAQTIVVTTGSVTDLIGIEVVAVTNTSSCTADQVGTHPLDIVADAQKFPAPTGTITVNTNKAAVIFGGANTGTTQTPTWGGGATGDLFAGSAAGNGAQIAIGHSTTVGAQTFTLAGSSGNGYGLAGFAGVVATWGP